MFHDLASYEPLIPRSPPTNLGDISDELRLYRDQTVEVWYAPMGDRPQNPDVWILGLTPGWNQMRLAYAGASQALIAGHTPAQAAAIPKPEVAYAGSMRRNLIGMLNELGVHHLLGLPTTAALFGTDMLRTGSVLKYPVFKRGRNYTGYSPAPTGHPILRRMLDDVLAVELATVNDCPILPLGKMAEQALMYSADKGRLDPVRVIRGFPHPSGANGHRHKQFAQAKPYLQAAFARMFKTRAA